MLKKSTLWTSYSSLSCCCLSSTSPTLLPPPRARPQGQRHQSYADIHSKPSQDSWPDAKDSSTPTPYEILRIERREPYSKQKFYELVKLYHPDRNGHDETSCRGIPATEKLRRYRLIILAHEILSDPVRRREYDRVGAGWGRFERNSSRHSRGYYGATSNKPFGTGPGQDGSPFQNATWEDWERWYRRDGAQPAPEGNFLSPNSFASIVILLAVITGVAQATKAGQYSASLEEQIQKINHETNSFMTSRADEHSGNGRDRGERVKWFLEKRDPARSGLKSGEEEAYKRNFTTALPQPSSSHPK